ncbi:MAG TPA: ubiquitin-like small modifier protein 1 [Nitrospiria bacterium]|jgi:molybdopterin synthase sulfur carrier subunit
MAVKVRIPTPLRKLTSGLGEIKIEGTTVQEIIDNLEKEYPGMRERLCDEGGELRRFVNFYLNEQDIRFIKGKETPLQEGDEISIVPAIAGG